jgi:hypothetical protein
MPTLSEFFGILIRMYWDDHPPPHFHAIYGMVVEWASLHKDELTKNWERCQVPAPTVPIQPLE